MKNLSGWQALAGFEGVSVFWVDGAPEKISFDENKSLFSECERGVREAIENLSGRWFEMSEGDGTNDDPSVCEWVVSVTVAEHQPTHRIVSTGRGGKFTSTLVQWLDDDDGNGAALYTHDELDTCTASDWSYETTNGLCWQGEPGGPGNFVTFELTKLETINEPQPGID